MHENIPEHCSDSEPLSVSQLNKAIRNYLESELGEISVKGEISNLKYHASGHAYFVLKDSNAQVRCVFFKNYQQPKTPNLKDGDEVVISGMLTLYETRGDYQIVVYAVYTQGIGDLYQQFEILKKSFQAKGFFDSVHKKPIPKLPQKIGIITSGSGAALHDCLTTLKRRYPIGEIIVFAVDVQGKNSAALIIQAILAANTYKLCDVLLLVRGGGSIEDLFVFNDPALVNEIFASQIPIITGIGHETDFTIADFVADHRAATPTAAAETAAPDYNNLMQYLNELQHKLQSNVNQLILRSRLEINDLQFRLEHNINNHLNNCREKYIKIIATINSLSPLNTLARGYAVVSQENIIIKDKVQIDLSKPLHIRFAKNEIEVMCTNIKLIS